VSDWIPFHRRLAKGPKRALPRAVRFVLLELSLEARVTKGVLDLPVEWTTLEAVHDLLGGDRDEIAAALKAFTESKDPTIEVERSESVHQLRILKWEPWAGPKTDAERQKEYRCRKRDSGNGSAVTSVTDRHDASVTPVTLPPLHPVTAVTPTGQDSTEQNRTAEAPSAPAAPRPDPIAEELAGHEVFRSLDLRRVRASIESIRISKGTPVPGIVDAIGECARKHDGAGLRSDALLRALIGFVTHASIRPRGPQSAPQESGGLQAHETEIDRLNRAETARRRTELAAARKAP
jgi:hypothetical protein